MGLEEVVLDVEVEGPATGLWLDVAGFEGENIESEGPKESRKEIPIGSERSAFFFAVSSNSAGLPPYTPHAISLQKKMHEITGGLP
jgi:hypothetical protein